MAVILCINKLILSFILHRLLNPNPSNLKKNNNNNNNNETLRIEFNSSLQIFLMISQNIDGLQSPSESNSALSFSNYSFGPLPNFAE